MGYDKSPDYGGPDPDWKEYLYWVVLVAVVVAFFAWMAYRR